LLGSPKFCLQARLGVEIQGNGSCAPPFYL